MGPHVCRHLVCQHRVEVEVRPAAAEVYFRDERYVNPADTVVQFHASVYNAPSPRVVWQVNALDGGPAAGSIDASGLYIAPLKGSLPYQVSELVTATSVDEPFRRASALVSVVGLGPEPKPPPKVEVRPRRVHLYYPPGENVVTDNAYIDPSNRMQVFRALQFPEDASAVEWVVDDTPPWDWPAAYDPAADDEGPEFLYQTSGAGSAQKTFYVVVRLKNRHEIRDWATVTLLNYSWPGIIA